MACGFYDVRSSPAFWSTSGCSVVNKTLLNSASVCLSAALYASNPNQTVSLDVDVTCSCSHLTEFAIFISGNVNGDPITEEQLTIFISFSVVYFLIAVVALAQFVRLVRAQYRSAQAQLSRSSSASSASSFASAMSILSSLSYVTMEHAAVFVASFLHAILLTLRSLPSSWSDSFNGSGGATGVSIALAGLLMLTPICVMLFAYTLLVITWYEVCEASNTTSMQKTNVRRWAKYANAGLSVLLLALIILLAASPDEQTQQTALKVLSALIATYTVIAASLFHYFSCRLAHRLLSVLGNLSMRVSNTSVSKSTAYRILVWGQLFAISFIASALTWAVSAYDVNAYSANQSLYMATAYSADVVALLTLLWLFHRAVMTAVQHGEDAHSKSVGSNNSTSTGSRHEHNTASTKKSLNNYASGSSSVKSSPPTSKHAVLNTFASSSSSSSSVIMTNPTMTLNAQHMLTDTKTKVNDEALTVSPLHSSAGAASPSEAASPSSADSNV